MKTLRIFDLTISVPDDVQMTTEPSSHWSSTYYFYGPSVSGFRAAFTRDAAKTGYITTYESETSCRFKQGERTILLSQVDQTQLKLIFTDAAALPRAQCTDQSICLAGIELTLPAGVEIRAGRECRRGPYWSEAVWWLRGVEALDVATHIHHELNAKKITSRAVCTPARGQVPPCWKVKGEQTKQLLVQASLTENERHIELELAVYGAFNPD
ncbi:hypothetical protein [Chondromyces crocatus]|nr:hypothetical protein [Chondromyces crocatus]